MMMIGIIGKDGPEAVAMIAADPGAAHMSTALGHLRALGSELLPFYFYTYCVFHFVFELAADNERAIALQRCA